MRSSGGGRAENATQQPAQQQGGWFWSLLPFGGGGGAPEATQAAATPPGSRDHSPEPQRAQRGGLRAAPSLAALLEAGSEPLTPAVDSWRLMGRHAWRLLETGALRREPRAAGARCAGRPRKRGATPARLRLWCHASCPLSLSLSQGAGRDGFGPGAFARRPACTAQHHGTGSGRRGRGGAALGSSHCVWCAAPPVLVPEPARQATRRMQLHERQPPACSSCRLCQQAADSGTCQRRRRRPH